MVQQLVYIYKIAVILLFLEKLYEIHGSAIDLHLQNCSNFTIFREIIWNTAEQ